MSTPLGVQQLPLSTHEKMALLTEFKRGPSKVRVMKPRVWLHFENAKTILVEIGTWRVGRLSMDPHRDERAELAEQAGLIDIARRAFESGEGQPAYKKSTRFLDASAEFKQKLKNIHA